MPFRDEEDVFGLEVAVDDAVLVGCPEGVGDLRGDGQGAPRSSGAARLSRSTSASPCRNSMMK
jgi:hypothetical protein